MKSSILYCFLVMAVCMAGCTRDNLTIRKELPPIHTLMGPQSLYHTLNITPDNAGKALSTDFMERWNRAVEALAQRSGRQLKSFLIRFEDSETLTINYNWQIPGGETAIGIFTYHYTIDDQQALSLQFVSADENAATIAEAIQPLKEDYFERYSFELGWIDDKIPGSKDILAAYYRTDDRSSYCYGVVGVLNNPVDVVNDRPLYYDLGILPKSFAGLRITSGAGSEQLSDDFRARWNAVRDALQAGGGRQLTALTLIFSSATELTATFDYTTSTGAAAQAICTYEYVIDAQGIVQLTWQSGNGNATNLAAQLQELTGYLEQYRFRMDRIDHLVPGSRGELAAWYRVDEPASFLHGELQKILPLYLDMGFGKTYSSLNVTPEASQAPLAPDFQERWDDAKDSLYNIQNAGRRLQSFRIRFISATQLTVTFTYGLSSGASATGMFTYSFTLNDQGLMKLTSLDAMNANANLIHPAVEPLMDEYFAQHYFRIDWFNTEHTLAAYYRADEPSTYFFGAIGN